MTGIIIGILEQGFICAIIALGVYITYTILDFPDLSVDGTFPLGAAITAFMLTKGMDPYLCILASLVCGALAGVITGLIHVKCHVNDLLSGIITMTALYSINLRVAGRSNVPLFENKTIFNSGIAALLPEGVSFLTVLIVVFMIAISAKLLMDWYLKTKSGFLLRAVGDNKQLVTSLAKNEGAVKILGLAIANALVAMAGSVMCQQQRFFEVTMGTGTIVMALSAVIIGTSTFKRISFMKPTTAVVIGAIIYKACIAIALAAGLAPTDMKLIMAILLLAVLVVNRAFSGKGIHKNA